MGTWVAEFFDGTTKAPAMTLELIDFPLALEAVCTIEEASNGQFVRLWPPDDATPEQLRRLMQAGALIVTKAS